jgi:hypothetical protein
MLTISSMSNTFMYVFDEITKVFDHGPELADLGGHRIGHELVLEGAGERRRSVLRRWP